MRSPFSDCSTELARLGRVGAGGPSIGKVTGTNFTSEPEPEPFVCGVCGRVLDHRSGVGYQHTLSDAEVGHEPVPVRQSEAEFVAGRCDFCFADFPQWIVPAHAFEVAPGHMSNNDWAACNECAELIEGDRWTGLLRRAKASWETRNGGMSPGVEANLGRLYRLLRRNISGSLQPNPALESARNAAAKFGRGWKSRPN